MQRGDTIAGRFALEDEVAAGGMGRIFRARDHYEGATVALKAMMRLDADGASRFARESSILARVGHPGIVRYVAHGIEPDGSPWLAMEWLEGHDLTGELARRRGANAERATIAARIGASGVQHPLPSGPMSVGEVMMLLRRVASAVAALHAEGIVHRDIKPSNVFLVAADVEHAKLLDLGTARAGATPDVTGTGMLVGTPAYMAPEQARAEAVLGPPVDVWALGCLAYECLVGHSPFGGDHVLAMLARILIEDPPPLRERRPDVPEPLAALIDRMLAKEPRDRPHDGAALLAELEAIDVGGEALPVARPLSPTIGAREQRVRCILLARSALPILDEDRTVSDVLVRASASAARLAEGTLLVTVPAQLGPTDQAVRAARAAIHLRESMPSVAIAIATGRAHDDSRNAAGDLSERAARMLEDTANGQIHLDAATAALIEGRFEIEREDGVARLSGAREAESTRTLLGRPTKTVGRRRELGLLQTTWDDCVAEPRSRAVLVTAGPGVGKSRVRSELLRVLERRGEPFTVLLGQGDSLSAGSPFVMIAPAIRRIAGILDGEALDTRRAKLRARIERVVHDGRERDRISAFLGEMIGAPIDDPHDDALRAARNDPMLLGEQMTAAFTDWLRAEAHAAPLLFVVEDLHWGDRPSVRMLDAALRALSGSPMMVLAIARPEVHDAFPALWSEHAPDEIRLEALTKKAAIELAREVLGARANEAMLEAIADRAAGNALYLEEIIRAVSEGESGALPDTVIGMVQARLETLGPDARRLLRAASVFGELFWEGGVRALVGVGHAGYDVREWLEDLARRELVTSQRDARIPEEREYRFRHALVRDAAYSTLTDDDRTLAHRLAGEWLERVGERDALVLASHFERGGDPASAIRWFRRASEQALEGNDLPAAIAAGERAIHAGADGTELGAVRASMATAAYWQSRYAEAASWAHEASTRVAPGSASFFVACGTALVSMARVGDLTSFDALFSEVSRADALRDERGAEAAQIVALCRGTFQLIFKGRFADADATLARIASLAEAAPDLDALTRAQVSHVRGVRAAMVGDVGHFLVNLEAAVEHFERAGDVRNVSLERSTVGWCYAEVGRFDRAIEIVRGNLEHCLRIKSQQAITYAKANLGYALSGVPAFHDDARRVLGEAIEETRAVANRRLEGWARGYRIPLLHAAGEHDAEEREASEACELLRASPGLLAWVLAARARALIALGRADEAVPIAREAMAILESLGGLLQGESMPPLVLAEALLAVGDTEAAHHAARDAKSRLERRAARLPIPEWRETFLAIEENRRTLALP